jgi:sugar/nucleoside kinase (ribokinase family)
MGLHTGSCTVNTGIALARLGCKVAVTGKVGQDGFGDFLIETLSGYGVGTRGVVRDPLANTSATMVMVDPDGERSFVHYLEANTAGATCITARGATTGIKSIEETLALVAPYAYLFCSGLSGSGETHDRQGRITEGQG